MKIEGRKKELIVNAIQKYKKDLQDLLLWDDCNLITQVLDEIYIEIKEKNSGKRKERNEQTDDGSNISVHKKAS